MAATKKDTWVFCFGSEIFSAISLVVGTILGAFFSQET
jgi:hypothetical protein